VQSPFALADSHDSLPLAFSKVVLVGVVVAVVVVVGVVVAVVVGVVVVVVVGVGFVVVVVVVLLGVVVVVHRLHVFLHFSAIHSLPAV
jgi:hypothetical protein